MAAEPERDIGRIRVCAADITLSRSGYSLQAREQDNDMPCWFGSARFELACGSVYWAVATSRQVNRRVTA